MTLLVILQFEVVDVGGDIGCLESESSPHYTLVRLFVALLTLCLDILLGMVTVGPIIKSNTPGTAGGPGSRDRTLAVKSRKNVRKITFFSLKNKIYPQKIFFFAIYLLVMPKYWVKNYFAHGRFPEVGQKQKTEKKREPILLLTLAMVDENIQRPDPTSD